MRCFLAPLASVLFSLSLSAQSMVLRVIENPQPIWKVGEQLRLSTTPTLVIGTQPGTVYEFGRIAGALRLTDDRIVVGDGASAQLRLFDATGTFLKALTRRGDGPGEVQTLSSMQWLPGDVIATGSSVVQSLFSSTGTLVGRIDLYRPPASMAEGEKEILAVFPGGMSVVSNIRLWQQTGHSPKAGLRWTDSTQLVVLGPGNRMLATLGDFPARIMEWGKEYDLFSPPFAPRVSSASTPQRFYVGFGSEFTIHIFAASGRHEMIIHRRWSPRRLDARGGASATLPAFDRMLVDRTGNLWVRQGSTSFGGGPSAATTQWSVFNPSGRWLGDVTMPPRFVPTDIGSDYVLGVSRDADDVETVTLYRLTTG